MIRFQNKHHGKWIAIKGQKIVQSGDTLKKLDIKVKDRKDKDSLFYALVPKTCIAG